MERIWRLYLDTSVFGGVFDVAEGFDVDSRRVIELCLDGRAVLLYSPTIENELASAPLHIRETFNRIPADLKVRIEISQEIAELSQAYLEADIVSPKCVDDTLHIAAASVAGADAIVSWNFKHMVRLDRIKEYNRVNAEFGYNALVIISPMEVNFDA